MDRLPSTATSQTNGTDEITEVVEDGNPYYQGRTGGKLGKKRPQRVSFQPYRRTTLTPVQVADKKLAEALKERKTFGQGQVSGEQRGWRAWGWGLAVKAVEPVLKRVFASGTAPRITSGPSKDTVSDSAHAAIKERPEEHEEDEALLSEEQLGKKEKLLNTLASKVSREEYLQLTELLGPGPKDREKERLPESDGRVTFGGEGARLSRHSAPEKQMLPGTGEERRHTLRDRSGDLERQGQAREGLRDANPSEARLQLDRRVDFRMGREIEGGAFGSPMIPSRTGAPEMEDGEEVINLAIEHMSRGSAGYWRDTPAGSRGRIGASPVLSTPRLTPSVTPASQLPQASQQRAPPRWMDKKPSSGTTDLIQTPLQARWTPLRTPVTGGRELLKRRASTALTDDGWSTGGAIRRTRLRQSLGGWGTPQHAGEEIPKFPRQLVDERSDHERLLSGPGQRQGTDAEAGLHDTGPFRLDSRLQSRLSRESGDGLYMVPSLSRSTADKILSQLDALSPTSDKGLLSEALERTVKTPQELEEQGLGQRAQRSMLRMDPPPPIDSLDAGGPGSSGGPLTARDKHTAGIPSPAAPASPRFLSPTMENYRMASKAIQDVAGKKAKGKAMAFGAKPSGTVMAPGGSSGEALPPAPADTRRESTGVAGAPPKKAVGFRMTAFLEEGNSDDEGKAQGAADTGAPRITANGLPSKPKMASGSSAAFPWDPTTSAPAGAAGPSSAAFSFQAPPKQGTMPVEEPATPRAMPSAALFVGAEVGAAEVAPPPTFTFGEVNGEQKFSSIPGALIEQQEQLEQPRFKFEGATNGLTGLRDAAEGAIPSQSKLETNHSGAFHPKGEETKEPTAAPRMPLFAFASSISGKPSDGVTPIFGAATAASAPSTAPSGQPPSGLLSFLQAKPEPSTGQSTAAASVAMANVIPSTSTMLPISIPPEKGSTAGFSWPQPSSSTAATTAPAFTFGKPLTSVPQAVEALVQEVPKEPSFGKGRDEGGVMGERAPKRRFAREFDEEGAGAPSTTSASFGVSFPTPLSSASMPGTTFTPSTTQSAPIFASAPSVQTTSAPPTSTPFPSFTQGVSTVSTFGTSVTTPSLPGPVRFGASDTTATEAPKDAGLPSFSNGMPATPLRSVPFGTTAPAFGHASTAASLFGTPAPVATPGSTSASPATTSTPAAPLSLFTFGATSSLAPQTSLTFAPTPTSSFGPSSTPVVEFGSSAPTLFTASAPLTAFGAGAASTSSQFSAAPAGVSAFSASTNLFGSAPAAAPSTTTPFSFAPTGGSAPAPSQPFVFASPAPATSAAVFGGFNSASTFGGNGVMGPSGTGSGSPNTAMEDSMAEEPIGQSPGLSFAAAPSQAQPLNMPFGAAAPPPMFAGGFGATPQSSAAPAGTFTFGAQPQTQQFDGTFAAGAGSGAGLEMGGGPVFSMGGGGGDAKGIQGRKMVKAKRVAKRGGR